MSSMEANQTPSVEDEEIIEKLKQGEPIAITTLYNNYFDRVYCMVFNRVGRDREAAQDVVQEIFLAASKAAKKFDARSTLYTWLYSIAYRKIADYYRRRERDIKRHNEAKTTYAMEVAQNSTETFAVDAADSEKMNRLVQETLSNLPVHYREVLLLKYVEELSVVEIGQVMNRSPKSVEGLLTRARKELKDNLALSNEG